MVCWRKGVGSDVIYVDITLIEKLPRGLLKINNCFQIKSLAESFEASPSPAIVVRDSVLWWCFFFLFFFFPLDEIGRFIPPGP